MTDTLIDLSTVAPDTTQLLSALQNALQTANSWSDILTTSTGTFLLQAISAIGALDQLSIENAYRESHIVTAKLDSSIYAGVVSQGVRLLRKTPGSLTADLTYTNTSGANITLPAYTQFTGGVYGLFNRAPIVLLPGTTTVSTTLYEGQVVQVNFQGAGTLYQYYLSDGYSGFTVSDSDVLVTIDGSPISLITDVLWNYYKTPAVLNFTSIEGSLILLFGDTTYGTLPALGSSVGITFVITEGSASNNSSMLNTAISTTTLTTLTGKATSGLTGGGDQPAASMYRLLGPNQFAANARAVRDLDYEAQAILYGGITDVVMQGQRDYAPFASEYMNIVRATVLPTSGTWTATQFTAFSDWMQGRAMNTVYLYQNNPISLPVDITVDAYCAQASDLSSVQASLVSAITTKLLPIQGSLKATLYKSIIYDLIQSNGSVSYLDMTSPAQDIYTAVDPAKLSLLLSGAAPSSSSSPFYQYYLTAVTASGESFPYSESIQVPASGDVTLNWAFVSPNLVTGYNIYKYDGTSSTYLLLGSTGPTINIFVDSGQALGTQVAPTVDTSGIYYVTAGTITINAYYATLDVLTP